MSCLSTADRQTEFDFYQQLMRCEEPEQCCGRTIPLSLTREQINILVEILTVVGMDVNYLDTFDPLVLDSHHMQLTMCSRHWLQLQDLLHFGSHQFDRGDWDDLSFYIFKAVCLNNAWDSKELSNYLS